ncbi:MAG: hypothetical protein ACJ74L_06395 [Gaiellaceae bacterium]
MTKAKKTPKQTATTGSADSDACEETPARATDADADDQEETPATTTAAERAEEKFVQDTVIRGDAAEPEADGTLPAEATHEIVEEREGELPIIKRRRFKAF